MAKYSVQAMDKTAKQLADANIQFIDADVENFIIEVLCDGKMHAAFRNVKFRPCNNLIDAMGLLSFLHADKQWNLRCIESGKDYEAWIEDKIYSAGSWNPARTIIAAMWNYKKIKDSEDELDAKVRSRDQEPDRS